MPISARRGARRQLRGAAQPPLLVLVVGETARADHFGLNGYRARHHARAGGARRAELAQRASCGTNTLASVPCMFSPLGKAGFEARKRRATRT